MWRGRQMRRASNETKQVAGVQIYVRGKELSPGASIYGFGGDVAATIMFPLSGNGQVTPGGMLRTRFQTVGVSRQYLVNGLPPPDGQLATVGLINDPTYQGGTLDNSGASDG